MSNDIPPLELERRRRGNGSMGIDMFANKFYRKQVIRQPFGQKQQLRLARVAIEKLKEKSSSERKNALEKPKKWRKGAAKNLHLCRVGAFENPQLTRGRLRAGFWIPLQGGLASPDHAIGSQRVLHRFVKRIAGSRTPQRFVRSLPAAQRDFTTS
jgi:hypothetical protein